MNTAIATRPIHCSCILTLALLMHGASADHPAERTVRPHAALAQEVIRCTESRGSQASSAQYDAHRSTLPCSSPQPSDASAPVELASPLPGAVIRPEPDIRYSF